MQNSFRWYGPNDPVKLTDIRQANAEYVVTSLHQIPYGEKWYEYSIRRLKENPTVGAQVAKAFLMPWTNRP